MGLYANLDAIVVCDHTSARENRYNGIVMGAKARDPVRLIDVAKRAGVSRVTVSHVLHGVGANVRVSKATRERVKRVARQLNYKPNRSAQQLRGARSKILGVIVDTWAMPVMSNRLSALEQEATRRGYRLIIGQARSDPDRVREYLDDFEGRGVEGVLCLVDLMRGYEKKLRPLFDPRTHLVFHGKPIIQGAACVSVDTVDGVRQSLAHVLDRGRQRPSLVLWNLADERSHLRRQGYRAELATRGLSVDERLIWSAQSESGIPSLDVLDRVIDTLVVRCGADALIGDDDVWAVRLIQRLKDRGFRVPADVAVVGYDNLDLAAVIDPTLTTVDQNHPAYAQAALDLAMKMNEDDKLPRSQRTVIIQPRLIVRDST